MEDEPEVMARARELGQAIRKRLDDRRQKKGSCDMYKVVGLNGKEMRAESFTEALKILYGLFPESFAQGKILQSCEKACYIEAVGETATARMYYPYVFEFAVKAGLIRNG